MAAVTICSDFGAQKNSLSLFPLFPHLFAMKWWAMILVFWMLSFKPAFSLFSFIFIKRLFSSSLLSAIRVVSSAYLRLLIFLLESLIPTCALSSPAFHIEYSACKLNKQSDNTQLHVCNFEPPHYSTSGSHCCFLTWIRISHDAVYVVWYFHFFRIFHSLLWSTQSEALA